MTKKKVVKLVVVGILLFFIASSALNYGVASEMMASDFREVANNLYTPYYFQLDFESTKNYKTECAESSGYSIGELFLYELNYWYISSRYPCSLAMADKNGNLIFAPKNYFLTTADEGHYLVYISIDEYTTDEFIREFNEFRSLADKRHTVAVNEISAYKNGNDYIPVSATFYIRGTDHTKTFVFSDYPVTDTFSKYEAYYCFNEIESASYNKKYYDLLEEAVKERYAEDKDNENAWNGGGGFTDSNESIGDTIIFIEGEEEFKIYYAMKYNQFLAVLFSDDFLYLTIYLAIMFIIAGSIFLLVCLKLLKKSEKLDQARKTFISAASHELKTPIAVIQNQCECVMENVAPEKNGEYIQSIYDEALRMNSIVTSLLSYNRLSQMTKINKENCDLSLLLKEEVEKYRSFAKSAGAEFIEDIADGVYAKCNTEMMKMAVDNLLSNAVKYSVGDKKIKVSLTADKKGFILSISNPADEKSKDISKNWDILARGDLSRERDGNAIGMGLPLCRRIFELHSYRADCYYEGGQVCVKVRPSGK